MSNSVAKIHPSREHPGEGFSLYAKDGGRKYLNLAERRRVLAAIAQFDHDRRLFALTLLWTGARVSEVLALTAGSFQVESGIVAFATLKRRRFVVREVPVPEAHMTELNRRYDLRASQSDPSWPNTRIWPWHRATAWRLIKDVMQRAQVGGRPACPRGLRHGFGVGTLQSGVPLNLVQRWLGHARMETTAIYADASGPDEREFAARFWRPD